MWELTPGERRLDGSPSLLLRSPRRGQQKGNKTHRDAPRRPGTNRAVFCVRPRFPLGPSWPFWPPKATSNPRAEVRLLPGPLSNLRPRCAAPASRSSRAASTCACTAATSAGAHARSRPRAPLPAAGEAQRRGVDVRRAVRQAVGTKCHSCSRHEDVREQSCVAISLPCVRPNSPTWSSTTPTSRRSISPGWAPSRQRGMGTRTRGSASSRPRAPSGSRSPPPRRPGARACGSPWLPAR